MADATGRSGEVSDNKMRDRKRKREKRRKLYAAPKFFLLFVLIFFVINLVFRTGNGTMTYTAVNGEIEEYVLTDGYVFRNQTMITSPTDGYLQCVVDEGERVKAGTVIGYVYQNEVDFAVTEEIDEIKSQIQELENEENQTDAYASSAAKVELDIAAAGDGVKTVRSGADMSQYQDIKSEINDLIDKKRTINGEQPSDEERLDSLNRRLNELESGVTSAKTEIVASVDGVFSTRIDGYEDALSFGMLGSVTPSYLEDINNESVQLEDYVRSGENICKIVDNYGWYFVAEIDEADAAGFSVNQSVDLRFYDLSDGVVSGTVTAVSQPERGKVAVTVYSTKYVESIYSTSKASAEILTASYSGIRVPSQCLRVVNDQQGVYVVRLDVARFVPVNVVYNNREWAIISSNLSVQSDYYLEMYDEVILDTSGVEDGEVVR